MQRQTHMQCPCGAYAVRHPMLAPQGASLRALEATAEGQVPPLY